MFCLLTRFNARENEDEIWASKNNFRFIFESRMEIPKNSLVVGRYSVLPYYQELERDLKHINVNLINSYEQHKFIADIENWYPFVQDFTPKTWFSRWDLISEGKYVVKGKTNSRKFRWNTHMFVENRTKLSEVLNRLYEDVMLSEQGLCVREFVPLKTFDYGINGMPFTNEWRIFFLGNKRIAHGYYWSIYEREKEEDLSDEGLAFAQKIAEIISEHTNFFVLDIAEKVDGEWILIEINDGQMSGLSMIDSELFYRNLNFELKNMENLNDS